MRKTTIKKPAAAPRETIVSRSTMSHAFEAAGRKVIRDVKAGATPSQSQIDVVGAVSDALERGTGTRKRPAWRVSKKGGR